VYFTPRFILKNSLGFSIDYRQIGGRLPTELKNGEKGTLHMIKSKDSGLEKISIRMHGGDSEW
jgi:hypothetical protein